MSLFRQVLMSFCYVLHTKVLSGSSLSLDEMDGRIKWIAFMDLSFQSISFSLAIHHLHYPGTSQ